MYISWSERETWSILRENEKEHNLQATPAELGSQVHFMVLMTSEILRAVNIKLFFAVAYVKSVTKTKTNTKTI